MFLTSKLAGALAVVRGLHWTAAYIEEAALALVLLWLLVRLALKVWFYGDNYRHYLDTDPFPAEVFEPVPGSLSAQHGSGAAAGANAAASPARASTRAKRGSTPMRAPSPFAAPVERTSAAPAATPSVVECFDKCTNEFLGAAPVMGEAEVHALAHKAKIAQRTWGRSSFDQRRAVLRAMLEQIVARQEEICEWSARDSGKTMMEAVFGEILTVCEKLKWTIEHGEAALASEARSTGFMAHKAAHVEYRPLGVIGIIAPYNYPFHHIISPLCTALFAGNGALIKVSEWTTWSLVACYRDVVRSALTACDVDQDLVQFVTGFGASGAAVVSSPHVDKIFFTGSPTTGKRVMLAAAETLKPVILELGGKDALVICEDANFDVAFNYAMRGVFMNAGQNCIGSERIYVFGALYDRFLERVRSAVAKLRVGAPLTCGRGCWDMGALTFPKQIAIVQALVDDALAKGATLVAGGRAKPDAAGGLFYEPTVLADVTHDMRIVHEEVFGPVMLVLRVESDTELVRKANDTKYGLSCSIFTSDSPRAARLAAAMETGMIVINDYGITYTMQSLPFGGYGNGSRISGSGKFNGPEGLREASATIAVVSDIWKIPTSIPRPFQYPVQSHAFALVEAAVRMRYGAGLRAKLAGGWSLLRRMLAGGK